MTTFDELCALEKQARDQALALGKARETMAHCSRLVHEKTMRLGSARLRVEQLDKQLALLKLAPVTILSEYEFLAEEKRKALELLEERRTEIKKLETQCLEAYKSLPGLERALEATNDRLATFGKVIPFR